MPDYDPAAVKLSPNPHVRDQAVRYEESGGTRDTDMNGSPCLLLDYRGRVSGGWHRTVLIYAEDGDSLLIVASNGGSDKHPLWFASIEAHPEVHVRVLGERFRARADVLPPEEKARVWPLLLSVFPRYEQYQRGTDRDIPVIRLRRA
ncbi:nitroreductase/quinone reductase family protein [Streptomyces sp. NBC_01298]|uniref:nitroreductase/quinone reductase family protein n=1 Tax=Streptomyces sp. NBC_01298 TaxID=2903817 RepID=UPI002E0F27D5|nr:nitroreductase/quinone reductase family protein [Streptomyces sp. NBC_01298]